MPKARQPRFDHTDDLLDAPVAHTLDLHGCRASAAGQTVENYINTQARVRRGQVVAIITGRGRNSREGPVLKPIVRSTLQRMTGLLVKEFDRGVDDGSFLVRLR